MRSINDGFANEKLSVTQYQGVITCIPKDEKPKQYLKNWRPNFTVECIIQDSIGLYYQ